jgi:DNA-binding beta-propeller fold protein YncE
VLAGSSSGHVDAGGPRAKFRNPGAMAWGPGDTLYVTDVDSIRKVSRDGTVATLVRGLTAADPDGRSSRPASQLFGLTYDEARSACYVADFGNRSVLKIDAEGQLTRTLQLDPAWSPVGVAVFGQALYVMEVETNPSKSAQGPRVRRITPDGIATTLATVKRDAPALKKNP